MNFKYQDRVPKCDSELQSKIENFEAYWMKILIINFGICMELNVGQIITLEVRLNCAIGKTHANITINKRAGSDINPRLSNRSWLHSNNNKLMKELIILQGNITWESETMTNFYLELHTICVNPPIFRYD